ncbi:MAG: hypothetical protein KDB22_04280 [Planctomycetales bacterium]|nr:hypothetical protein [Planctomycetales bacterium]
MTTKFAVPKKPDADGEVNLYVNSAASGSHYFDRNRYVIFINGMGNSPTDHVESALGLSELEMCSVVGVYNKSSGTIADLMQCLGDKQQFDGVLADTPAKLLKANPNMSPVAAMEQTLSRNQACLSLFRVLRDHRYRSADIFAHSQGNLILSNALSAVLVVGGPVALQGRKVYSFGSPAMNWPPGLERQEYGFTFDPVNWLAGLDTSFTISKVGLPINGDMKFISHSFKSYRDNDPAFVVNRFRIGGWGLTFHLDKAGLAAALVKMGRNVPRVFGVFRHLDQSHNFSVDDVALLYVQKIQALGSHSPTLAAIKQHPRLRDLLIHSMKTGYTCSEEKAAIKFLESL